MTNHLISNFGGLVVSAEYRHMINDTLMIHDTEISIHKI